MVESLYSWEEYLMFKKAFGLNFVAIAVCANPKIRHKRSMSREERAIKNEKEAWSRDYSQIENLAQGGAQFTLTLPLRAL